MKSLLRNNLLEQLMCEAIQRHLELKLLYDDDPVDRLVRPYILFEDPVTKTILLFGYQTGNASKPSSEPGWKVYVFYSISHFIITRFSFSPDPQFRSHHDMCGMNILAAVDRTPDEWRSSDIQLGFSAGPYWYGRRTNAAGVKSRRFHDLNKDRCFA